MSLARCGAIAGGMACENRGRGRLARRAAGTGLLLLLVTACAPLVGGIALVGAVSIGALTTRCYDYIDVTVLDAEGRKTCAATVTASDGHSEFNLESCYYAALTDGRWMLRASLAGAPVAVSTVVVDHTHDCTRYVQSVELTLAPPNSPRSRPAVPSVPSAMPSPVPAQPAPTSTAPSSPESAPVPATTDSSHPPSAPPAPSASPPVGAFPDSSETSQ